MSREKPWIGRLGLSVDYGLELDRVPPVVTNVVNIPEALVPRLNEDVGERRLLGRQGACSGEIPIAIGNAIDDIASDAELVQMIALPAHHDLNDAMQLVETDGKLNLDAPTDEWLHLIERDGKSGDLLGTGHAARLADRQGRFQGRNASTRLVRRSVG